MICIENTHTYTWNFPENTVRIVYRYIATKHPEPYYEEKQGDFFSNEISEHIHVYSLI